MKYFNDNANFTSEEKKIEVERNVKTCKNGIKPCCLVTTKKKRRRNKNKKKKKELKEDPKCAIKVIFLQISV